MAIATSLLSLLAMTGTAHAAEPAIAWCSTVEVAAGGGFRGPWRMNESQYDYVDDPSVAIDARGAAAVAWVDQRRKDVFFQVFDRSGKPRLAQPVNVSRTPRVLSWLPRVALSGRHAADVYVLWQEIVFAGGSHGGDIFFARSRDGGASFGKPLNLSNSVAGDGKGRINKDIWHNGSLDLAVGADGVLYAAWTEYEGALWISRSSDRGENFSRPLQIAGSKATPARAPAFAVAGDGALYIAWTVGEDDHADIRLARSGDGGRTFGEPRIVAQTTGYSDAPKIAVDARGTLHLVHGESTGGPFDRYHIRYARSHDQGRTFEAGREISRPQPQGYGSGGFPALSLDAAGNVYVLWELFRDHREAPRALALAVSRDAGKSFGVPVLVSAPDDGFNGGQQGLLMRKLAASDSGGIAVVNSTFKPGVKSAVTLRRGILAGSGRC